MSATKNNLGKFSVKHTCAHRRSYLAVPPAFTVALLGEREAYRNAVAVLAVELIMKACPRCES